MARRFIKLEDFKPENVVYKPPIISDAKGKKDIKYIKINMAYKYNIIDETGASSVIEDALMIEFPFVISRNGIRYKKEDGDTEEEEERNTPPPPRIVNGKKISTRSKITGFIPPENVAFNHYMTHVNPEFRRRTAEYIVEQASISNAQKEFTSLIPLKTTEFIMSYDKYRGPIFQAEGKNLLVTDVYDTTKFVIPNPYKPQETITLQSQTFFKCEVEYKPLVHISHVYMGSNGFNIKTTLLSAVVSRFDKVDNIVLQTSTINEVAANQETMDALIDSMQKSGLSNLLNKSSNKPAMFVAPEPEKLSDPLNNYDNSDNMSEMTNTNTVVETIKTPIVHDLSSFAGQNPTSMAELMSQMNSTY